MVERIRLLLEARQLSPTQFADAIGIARPIVSHILSGRNKPSLEVVQRILSAMPDLSMPWLLNGTGPMVAAGTSASAPVTAPEPNVLPVEPAKVPYVAPFVSPAPSVAAVPKAVKSRQAPLQSAAEPIREDVSATRVIPRRFTPKKPEFVVDNAVVDASVSQHLPAAETAPMPEPSPVTPTVAAPASVPETNPAAQLIAGSDKPIRRIVIFYRDGSFADFQPE